jgi:hypothetical protein
MNPNAALNLTAPRWQAGVSPNPGGKPQAARNRLSTAFLYALARDFDENGKAAIEATREKDPGRYLSIVASLLPKQVEAAEPMGELGDGELLTMIAFLRGKLAEMTPEALENLRTQMTVANAPTEA